MSNERNSHCSPVTSTLPKTTVRLLICFTATVLLMSVEEALAQDSSMSQQESPVNNTETNQKLSLQENNQTRHARLRPQDTMRTEQGTPVLKGNSRESQENSVSTGISQTGFETSTTKRNSLRNRQKPGLQGNSSRNQRPSTPKGNSPTDQDTTTSKNNSQTIKGASTLEGNSSTYEKDIREGQILECETIVQDLTESEKNIVWIQPVLNTDCVYTWEWLIEVPTGNGIVFEFRSVEMLNNLTLSIHKVEDTNLMRSAIPPLWSFSVPSLAPLVLTLDRVLVVVTVPLRETPSVSNKPSHFNLNYAAHPLRTMPEQIHVDPESLSSSKLMYNCSSFPNKIPAALMCDMIQQCVGGEDEANCSYKGRGCGDWIPYADHCLKAFFQPIVDFNPGVPHITMPFKAQDVCRSRFRAKLANLPDEVGIQLVGNILRHSGYQTASVGLKKMRPLSSKTKHLYKYIWQWGKPGSPVAYEQTEIQRRNPIVDCAMYDLTKPRSFLRPIPCNNSPKKDATPEGFICMKRNLVKRVRKKANWLKELHLGPASRSVTHFQTKPCPDGSLVQTFHECKWRGFDMDLNPASAIFPKFECTLGHEVHVSLVCDAVDDCADGSDEIKCRVPRFQPLLSVTFMCMHFQTIHKRKHCDGLNDCFDNSDEEGCFVCKRNTALCPGLDCIPLKYRGYFTSCQFPFDYTAMETFSPAAVDLDGYGMSSLKPVKGDCGERYFQCDSDLCIPVFLLNNGEQDCPDGIDENIPIQNFTCPGYYRCQEYGNCIHSDNVCDGIYHCPNKDDERYCDLNCPHNCTCEGYAFKCQAMFDPHQHLMTRYLDLSGVVCPELQDIEIMEYLLFLNLSHCQLRSVNLTDMSQLRDLDLSYNLFTELSAIMLSNLTGLEHLVLSNNPLVQQLNAKFVQFVKVAGLTSLESLMITNTELRSIEDDSLSLLPELTNLDISGNDITGFSKNVFRGLEHLELLRTDNYKLCCSYFHFVEIPYCYAPVDELSSCSDLLNGYFYHISVWILALLNIPANITVIIYRLFEMKRGKPKGYTVLIANLCLSDLLMGIYLIFIGSADVHYRHVWVSKENEWRNSEWCKTAGILAFVSSEVSAFVICLITLERLLVMCFPLKLHLHMTTRLTTMACMASWLLGLLLAVVPLMVGWDFYGQNGFCLPLPITRSQFPGQAYAFAIFIVLNFVLFIFIGVGQIWIYRAIRRARLDRMPHNKLQDTTVARRLLLITTTDFCCWFPIGLMGLMAFSGIPIPGEVNVWAALFILPFNSALNPHLYTLNSVVDRYREQRLERRIKKTIGKINAEIKKWPEDKVETLLRSCLRARVVQKEKVLKWMNTGNRREEGFQPLELQTMKDDLHLSAETDLSSCYTEGTEGSD